MTEKIIIPRHLNDVNIYHPFLGSNKERKIRKGLIDLIIPNGAGPKVLSRLFYSLLDNLDYTIQSSNGLIGGVRMIIVSQGEHGSKDLLYSLKQTYPDTVFPVFRKHNRPPPVPYNDGLFYSARIMNPLSEYIMFLDDDMVMLKKGMIQLEKEHLEKYKFDNVATEHCFFGSKDDLKENGEAKDFGMGSFFFRRKLFEKIGYLDEYFHFHCSDTDYNKRIRMYGGKIAIVPETRSYMFHEHQQGTHNFYKGNHQKVIDNDWVLFRKKWNHITNHSPDVFSDECEECFDIKVTQLPLGRTKYPEESKLISFEEIE